MLAEYHMPGLCSALPEDQWRIPKQIYQATPLYTEEVHLFIQLLHCGAILHDNIQ